MKKKIMSTKENKRIFYGWIIVGIAALGLVFDIFGGYREIILLMIMFPLLGSIASFISPAPRKNEK